MKESEVIKEPPSKAPKGVYVHGGVGTGKTFLMDMFFDEIVCQKQRVHFHEFMLDVHRCLHELKGANEPLRRVADDIVDRGWLVCFDEFQVTDIADALVMKQLFEELFAAGVLLWLLPIGHLVICMRMASSGSYFCRSYPCWRRVYCHYRGLKRTTGYYR